MTTLAERAAAIDWWHGGIDLGGGVVTQGRTYPGVTLLPYLHLPTDLVGKTVIDICAWDGFMAFEAEKRGATVTVVDSFAWDKANAALMPGLSTGRDGFVLACAAKQSRVKAVYCDVLDLSAKRLGTFDIVLFLGVLYHMRHPLLALEKVAALVADGGKLIIETHVDMLNTPYPAARFYPDKTLNNDPTNWWGPNVACVEAMLHDIGFVHVTTFPGCGTGRAVFHAWGRV